jgi:hypothetical protein
VITTLQQVRELLEEPDPTLPEQFDLAKFCDDVLRKAIRRNVAQVDDTDQRRARQRNEQRAAQWRSERSRRG